MEATVTLPDGDADDWRLFQERTAQGMDLLSSLPDKLISYNFHFLPIMDVVRTSILSKCWHRRWIRTPAINIYWEEKKVGLELLDYVDKILRGCDSSRLAIDKFHIYSYPVPPLRYLMERYDAWVRFAVDRQVKDLYFELKEEEDVDDENTPEFYEFPKEIFDCQSMVKFHVRRCSFPLLERLELKNCFSRQRVGISSQEMRELVIRGYSFADRTYIDDINFSYFKDYEKYEDNDDEDEECDNSLQICAPRLQSLRLLGSWCNKTMILLEDVPPLIESHLDFKEPDKCCVVEYILNTLLGNLCSAEKLFIGRYCLEVADNPGLVRIAKIMTYTKCRKAGDRLDSQQGACGKFIDGPFESNERDFGNMKCLAESLARVEIIGIDAAHVHVGS
ncbi:hypothetical protein MLD38_031011 [Melastoma candidum]|uniref:Uncharacterized protein n=1 Tax=Melastoma candidum TaxID=119954 RepID=A0ACB9MQI2_9MYRT|nr:hypothetical protein MLD38_031011 [Melastoma candidum]